MLAEQNWLLFCLPAGHAAIAASTLENSNMNRYISCSNVHTYDDLIVYL
jgi:hypothetical protein